MTPAAGDGRPHTRTLALTAVALLLLAYPLRYVLLPFAVAGGLAFATSPAVRWLKARLRFPHIAAVGAVFLPTSTACAALAYWVGLALIRRVGQLADAAPAILAQLLRDFVGDDPTHADATARQICQQVTEGLTHTGGTEGMVAVVFGGLMAVVLTIVLYFFFLCDAERLARGALWLVPPRWREATRATARRARPVLQRYFIGLVVVVAFTAAAAWVFLGLILGLPDAELLAVATGLLELIPVIGPIASAALVSGAALARGGAPMLVGFLLFYAVLRLVIDQIIGPVVLGRAVRLHPVVILFAMLAGGALYGALGVLLAVPVAAMVVLLLKAYYGEADASDPPKAGANP